MAYLCVEIVFAVGLKKTCNKYISLRKIHKNLIQKKFKGNVCVKNTHYHFFDLLFKNFK